MEASSTAIWGVALWRSHQLAPLELTKSSLFLALATICTMGIVSRCFYNLYLHPLRNIPGPKLAAMSSWPDFYYDIVKDGSYLFQIREMHGKYGKFELSHAIEHLPVSQ